MASLTVCGYLLEACGWRIEKGGGGGAVRRVDGNLRGRGRVEDVEIVAFPYRARRWYADRSTGLSLWECDGGGSSGDVAFFWG